MNFLFVFKIILIQEELGDHFLLMTSRSLELIIWLGLMQKQKNLSQVSELSIHTLCVLEEVVRLLFK